MEKITAMSILFVALGGALGAVFRFLVSTFLEPVFPNFPLGTLVVNIVGGLIIGILFGASLHLNISQEAQLFLVTGILGGLTTFSTFSMQTVELLASGQLATGLLNIALNLFGALGACWFGYVLSA